MLNPRPDRRLRILICAFHCEPDQGSEAGVGWTVARRMAEHHDVWVLTQGRYRSAIERALDRQPVHGMRFAYFDLPGSRRLHRNNPGIRLGLHFYYYLWQWFGVVPARRLHQEVGFDLVHHVTVVKYSMPSFLAFVDAPLLWGPVGGGESGPAALIRECGMRAIVHEKLRDFARWLGSHDPLVRVTARRSDMALATTNETAERLMRIGAPVVRLFPYIGISEEDLRELGKIEVRNGPAPVRFLSMGNLIHWKGFHLGLRAFEQAAVDNSEYWIVGDGPARRKLEQLSRALQIEERVVFWGSLSRDAALERLAESDILVHPSLHDSTGWAVLEAMAAARPIICLDLGGPAARVSARSGVRVVTGDPKQVVPQVADAMRRLAVDAGLRAEMGAAARSEVWDQHRRAAMLNDLYAMLGAPGGS